MATIETIFTRAVEKETLPVLRKECYLRPCSRGAQYSSGKISLENRPNAVFDTY